MAGRKSDFTLTKLDDLFTTQAQRDEEQLSKIRDIPLELIDDFPDHPFKVRDDEDMMQLVESVKERGVITPATVRQKEDGRYELVSGHRRKRACELAGFETLRSEIVDLNRDEATILMVESNFQRSEILPSEKAFAYKMRLEAMKRQGFRSDLTSDPVGQKFSVEKIADNSNDSKTQIQRYIRLTNLVPELLEFVDEGRIKMRPAVELSYLDEDCQRDVVDEIDLNDATPSHDQTIRMRKLFNEGNLTTEAIHAVMSEEKPNQKEKIVLRGDRVRQLIPKNIPVSQTEDFVCKALEHNPFVYLQNDNDVQKLVTNLFKSTTPKGSQAQDPFWDTSASMLLLALVFYLHYEAPEDEQNFAMIMEMLRAGAIEDEEDTRPSPLDELFAELEMSNPDHIALKSFKFTDINFAVASREDKEAMFLEYSELLNSLDSGATTKLTINNRRLNRLDFEKTILIPETGDELDVYREEYNKMLLDKATGANAIVQDKYVTISINKKSVEDARTYFARVGADLIAHFARLGSKCVELETDERLRIVHDFFRVGEETAYHFNIKETRKKGHDFKDYVCPDTMEFEKDYFKMGNRYGRVLFLREYASYIKDSMVAELTDLNRNLMMSIDIVPVPTDEAVREAESRLLGVETNITNWQRKQNQNNNFSATVPYDMEQQKKEMKEFLDDLTTRDQRMMFAVLTMVHTADSKEQLDNDTEALLTTARKHLCQFAVLKYQQMDGLNTAMPFGTRKIDAFRTLTTESLAVFIPFRVQDIYHENGIYYGQNVISKNMIIADRRQLLNGNSFILGVSGGGKSFAAKGEIENIILSSNADVIIIDPEREYSQLVKALGGEIINISATSPSHINAMDMNKEYGDGANPVILKSEFIMSLCEQLIGGTNLGAKQKSIIDRCTASVYRDYQQRGYTGTVPTLQDFRAELLKQDEPEAKEIALAIELFTHGSLNTFAKPTNVDTDNRLICYDILDLGKQLMPIGMLVVLDSILNRITQNRAKGKQTFIFIDEIYLLFQHEYSANFLFTLWKRVRKYGAYATGITQNVDDLLQSHTARTMLANSEFLIMLNQASTDRIELAKLLNISDLQLSYITNVDAGHGLIKVGSSLVPFANKFPKNTKLYKLMTTKPGEGV